MPLVLRWVPAGWSLVLASLLLGPALAPGFVLTYDMVWVPDLALRPDALGVGSALPRAVPSDAVVAVLDEVLPGAWLQKVVLLGSLVAAGVGGARLVSRLPLGARLVAVTVMVWNPFVVERLVIGHWPVLVGYAVLPWVLVTGARYARAGRVPPHLGVLVVLGSLSASTGLATAVAALATRLGERTRGRLWLVILLLVGGNAPWFVSGVLHGSAATSDPDGAHVFATSAEGLLPAPLAALGLGGIWNAEAVPGSRTGWLGVIALAVIVGLAVTGARGWWRGNEPLLRRALLICWAVGLGVALLSWLLPGQVGRLAATVPGGGLLRDGSRLLALAAPLTAALAAHGAARLSGLARDRVTAAVLAGAMTLVPVTLMPDAAWGVQARLAAVDLPTAYTELRDVVEDEVQHGDVVVLPFTSYRAPAWNDHRKVLDPLPRLVPRDVVSSDSLQVSGRTVSGEDPRAREVTEALAEPRPADRAAALARLGVGAVVADVVPGQEVPEVIGEKVYEAGGVQVIRLRGVVERGTPTAWSVMMTVAWIAWLVVLVGALPGALWRRRRSGEQGLQGV